ncbi:uncharacterized protein LOC131160057 isoform X1 [Malania oleifera]|uniref:uncharacterized protein LOC131160057 isoform X1 n=1 Tax=Malania oleifera TaxID=397392 RepID=UPI0025AEBCA9|nr:uncharacterized protein LOC131160057 isoform X1 [Malania oleifera]
MSMAKFVAVMLLTPLSFSILQSTDLAAHGHGSHHYNMNAHHNARGGAARRSTISHACSSVRSAAGSACACPRGIMGTKLYALATTTGRPSEEDPNVLELARLVPYLNYIYSTAVLSFFP